MKDSQHTTNPLSKNIDDSEALFRNMAENSDVLIAMGDASGNAIYFNRAWTSLTGRPMHELLKSGWIDLLDAEDQQRFETVFMPAFEKKEAFSIDFKIRDNYGKLRWIESKNSPRFSRDGLFSGYISSCSDVTESRAAEFILRQDEARFRNVANNAPVLIWMSGTDKKYNFFNSAWLEFTGRSLQHEHGDGSTFDIHPDDIQNCLAIYENAFEKREGFNREYRLRHHDGTYRWVSDKAAPHFSAAGEFEGYIGACMDNHDKLIAQKKIKENEERLNIVIEASGLGIWELNLETTTIQYSPRYLEILGFSKDANIPHEALLKRLHPDDLPLRNTAFEQAYKTGILQYEARIIWDDQSVHWIEGKGKLLYGEKNEPEKMVGTVRDITEEKLREQELVKSERKFRMLADSMPQHIWTSDPNGNMNYFNASVYKYSGFSAEELEKASWLEIVHPDDREQNVKRWKAAVESGEDFIFEHRFRRHDGVYRWQLSRAIPQKDDFGNIQMWVGSSTDIEDHKMFAKKLEKEVDKSIKELKALNETLAKSEERYHLMVEEVQDYAILYLNREGVVENWNLGAEKIKGYTSDEIIGRSFSDFYTMEDRKNNLPQNLLKTAVDKGRARQEGWRVRKNGSYFWASVTITAVHNQQGEVIGFSKVTHDLTEKKETSEQLKTNAAILLQKNAELEKMNKELESFAYISSHDLQEPLRKIQTFSSRIQDMDYDTLSENAKDNFRRMQNAAKRMQVLIEDLLVYSRTSDAERKYVKSDLKKLVGEAIEELTEEITPKNAIVEIGELGKADVIPFQFRQLMQNLLSNSLKFSKENVQPHIKISGENQPGSYFKNKKLTADTVYCHLTIADNGIGFDPEYSEKIFEVFQRLHGKNEYVGTGIGLAIVKKIVDNLNGVITATAQLQQGATFDIYFPVTAKK